MLPAWMSELERALVSGRPCALLTVAATRGSVPRQAGTKMVVFADGSSIGTIGGGKFEALALADAIAAMSSSSVSLKTYPLREGEPDSFGAICGGEVTVLIEPQQPPPQLVLVGAGHCSVAIAKLASECGWQVTVIDDREAQSAGFAATVTLVMDSSPTEVLRAWDWRAEDALVLVSRNYEIDRDALGAALQHPGAGYVGMIGSRRKVQRVFAELKAGGVTGEQLAKVHAPLGLDIGADSPAEIAVSVMAEILKTMRERSGQSFSDRV